MEIQKLLSPTLVIWSQLKITTVAWHRDTSDNDKQSFSLRYLFVHIYASFQWCTVFRNQQKSKTTKFRNVRFNYNTWIYSPQVAHIQCENGGNVRGPKQHPLEGNRVKLRVWKESSFHHHRSTMSSSLVRQTLGWGWSEWGQWAGSCPQACPVRCRVRERYFSGLCGAGQVWSKMTYLY